MTLHTDIPTRSEIEGLLTARETPCVSMYLPTSPLTQDAQAERIELKNLTSAAAEQIDAAGTDRRTLSEVREPLEELVEDDEFWAEQARDLAVFDPRGGCGPIGSRIGSPVPSRSPTVST